MIEHSKSALWRHERDARRRAGRAEANKSPRKAPKPLRKTKLTHQFGAAARYTSRPLRAIEAFFKDLSHRGQQIALHLKFGPVRTHGSSKSLRAWPRGLPGTGRASWLSRPELLRRIADLKRFVGVKQYG